MNIDNELPEYIDHIESLIGMQEELTPELIAKQLSTVALHHGKNEKLAFNRKIKKMEGLIESIRDYEQMILDIVKNKQPIADDIRELRAEMVKECIHPKDHLIHCGTYIFCKFCEKKISLPRLLK